MGDPVIVVEWLDDGRHQETANSEAAARVRVNALKAHNIHNAVWYELPDEFTGWPNSSAAWTTNTNQGDEAA